MTTITTVPRNNISQLLNKPVASQKTANFSQSEFISSVDNVSINNAADNFIKLPSQTSHATDLFDEMALQGLPDILSETHSDWKGDAVRNMLGIIYKDAEPEDLPKFDKVFREFARADSKFTKDAKVASELGFLFHKYGESALSKVRDDYIQHCRDAWKYHHDTQGGTITDEDIFTPGVMACYEIVNCQIKELSKPEQSWATIICGGTHLKNSCAALSKVLKFHDASPLNSPAAGSPLSDSPQKASEVQQPNDANTTVTLPAAQGHGAITINNTNTGGNGAATVDGNSPYRAPASDIDFGIALLNTPDDQLGNEKARLVEKFMDLYWGRAQNGGRDKFSDHVDKVIKSEPPLIPFIATLPAPPIFHAVEEVVVASAPQFANVNLSEPQPAVNQALASTVTDNETLIDNTILSPERQQVSAQTVDTRNNLHGAATQVSQALSALLTEVDTAGDMQSRVQHARSGSVIPVDVEAEQELNSTTAKPVESANHAGRSNHMVQQMIRKFEALNTHHLMARESEMNRRATGKTERTNIASDLSRSNSPQVDFQPLKQAHSNFKHDVSVKQVPLYTTQRTIDPFSRHSLDLKHLVPAFNQRSEKEETQEFNSDLVSRL